jgi:hypothetical protein
MCAIGCVYIIQNFCEETPVLRPRLMLNRCYRAAPTVSA